MRALSLSFAAAILSLTAALPAAATPVISEFQAENKDTIEDADGNTSDWVEIYNPDPTPADLTGMALTDDIAVPQKWVFPAVSLPAKGYLLVWCSGKDRKNPAAELHTNFDLEKDGEYLALVAADGTTKLTEWNPYPPQEEDRSFGSAKPVLNQTPVGSGASCRWRVPTAAIPGWETTGFVDTAWVSGATGVGYDNDTTSATSYKPTAGPALISPTGVVPNNTISVYVRIPFSVTNVEDVLSLTLRMKYDDGFAAFLNGTRLNPPTAAESNAPASLVFNSTATAAHGEEDAFIFRPFDISSQKSLLINGVNVLAIQALNLASSSDLVVMPELQLTKVDSAAPNRTGYFAVPSPGANNITTPVDGFVDAPDFSVKRGFLPGPVSVTLTTHTPGAQIRFTTNGSAPTATTGTVFTAPISVFATTVLRAGAFRTGWQPSTVKTHTYLFASQVITQPAAPGGFPTTWGNEYNFTTGQLSGPTVPADYRMDPTITTNPAYPQVLMLEALQDTLPIISLAGDVSQIFGTANGIYSNGRLTPGLELAVSMEFWKQGGKENWQENVGLRMHGGDAPLEHPKKPFRVYFRKQYGAGRLEQPLFPGSPVQSFDKLQLRPGGHDGWSVPFGSNAEGLARHAVYCRDRFLRQTELDMGRLAHRGRYAHMYINGLYWGVYDLHEVQSHEFFSDHLGGEDEDWDVVEHSNTSNPLFSVVDGTGAAMDAALALVRPASNAANPATYEQLKTYIDYNELIDNMIVQMWGAQNDWLGPVFRGTPGVNLTDASRFFNKNWEAGRRSRGPDPSPFYFQVWDAEISMGNSLSSLVPTMRVANFNHTLVGTPVTDTSNTGSTSRTAGVPGPPAEIYYALRKYNRQFRMKVADRLQKHFFNDGAMTVSRNQARLLALRNELDLPIIAESARWGDVNRNNPDNIAFTRNDQWRPEMDWLRDTYIATRNNTLLTQFGALGMYPSTAAPAFSQFGGTVPIGFQLTINDPNAAGGTIYYTLDGSDPMVTTVPPPMSLAGTAMNSTCRYIVATDEYGNNGWKNLPDPANIASWSTGSVALGFDANPTYAPHIVTTVTGMRNVNSSLYIRIPFTVTAEQKAAMTGLSLKMKYDDGAYVFLNGSAPLFRFNDADSTGQPKGGLAPKFNDRAEVPRPEGEAVVFQTIDLTSQIAGLTVGQNLLCIQGLNQTVADDDFLCSIELAGTAPEVDAPAATAVAVSGPVTLPQSGTVKARIVKNGVWSALTEASFILGVPGSATNVTISEFSYNPVATGSETTGGFTGQQFEFVELMNISAGPVDMTGCRFDDGISFEFPDNSIIGPGQRILLVADQAAFETRHPGVPVFGVFAEQSNLSNSGERLELLDAAAGHIFDFVYDDKSPWPESADGEGFSLVLVNPMSDPDPGNPANWRASAVPGGSPGGADSDTFADWVTRNNVTGGMEDDFNGDGVSNLVEYGLGLTPGSGLTSGIISATFETVVVNDIPDVYLVLRYRRNYAADDVRIVPEFSTNLATWSALNDEVVSAVTHPDGTEEITRRSPRPVTERQHVYVRVSVTSR